MTQFFTTMLGAALVNNLVLVQFLGVSSVFNYSRHFHTALFLALFTAPVMIGTMVFHQLLYRLVLLPFGLDFLELICLAAIAGLLTSGLIHLTRRLFPHQTRQQLLLLFMVAANSAVLGAALKAAQKDLQLGELLATSCGSALGFFLILLALAAIRERLASMKVPGPFRGLAIELIGAGLAAMALLGFAGVV